MSLSMYNASVFVFSRMLKNLSVILSKAELNAQERNIPAEILLEARLAPDMHALAYQIRAATYNPKEAVARLSGRPAPFWPDEEGSFADLQKRIQVALDFFAEFEPGDIEGSEARQVALNRQEKQVYMTGEEYILTDVLPNFFFHLTAAYSILRHNGVPIGKSDFIG